MELLEGGKKSLFKRGALWSQRLQDLSVQVKHHIVLFHGGKGIIEGFDISHSVLRVGGCAYDVSILIRNSLQMERHW